MLHLSRKNINRTTRIRCNQVQKSSMQHVNPVQLDSSILDVREGRVRGRQ